MTPLPDADRPPLRLAPRLVACALLGDLGLGALHRVAWWASGSLSAGERHDAIEQLSAAYVSLDAAVAGLLLAGLFALPAAALRAGRGWLTLARVLLAAAAVTSLPLAAPRLWSAAPGAASAVGVFSYASWLLGAAALVELLRALLAAGGRRASAAALACAWIGLAAQALYWAARHTHVEFPEVASLLMLVPSALRAGGTAALAWQARDLPAPAPGPGWAAAGRGLLRYAAALRFLLCVVAGAVPVALLAAFAGLGSLTTFVAGAASLAATVAGVVGLIGQVQWSRVPGPEPVRVLALSGLCVQLLGTLALLTAYASLLVDRLSLAYYRPRIPWGPALAGVVLPAAGFVLLLLSLREAAKAHGAADLACGLGKVLQSWALVIGSLVVCVVVLVSGSVGRAGAVLMLILEAGLGIWALVLMFDLARLTVQLVPYLPTDDEPPPPAADAPPAATPSASA